MIESQAVPPRPWIAALLSLITPGLGQFYAGKPFRAAFVFVLATLGVIVALIFAMSLRGSAQLYVVLCVVAAAVIAPPLDAYRCAREIALSGATRRLFPFYVNIAIAVAAIFLVQAPIRRYLLPHILRTYKVPTTSMEPLLLRGEFFVARIRHELPVRGEVVAFRSNGNSFVKRIVGMPGDTLSMASGQLEIDGHEIAEPYAVRGSGDQIPSDADFAWQRSYLIASADRALYKPTLQAWGPIVIPPGQYFMLGDNRGNSLDSRYTGFVADSDVFAFPTVIYFSRDSETKRVRWSRIGRAAQ